MIKPKTLVATLLALLVGIVIIFVLTNSRRNPRQSQMAVRMQFFETQAECEQTTAKSCGIEMCDYIPAGKTVEQTCGKGFHKGVWGPVNGGR